MRCLTCFKPAESLTEKLSKEKLTIPASGLHCTLWGFNINEKNESDIVLALSAIKAQPFSIGVIGYSKFDEDSHVLVLSKPQELQGLHEKIVRTVRPFDKNPSLFDLMVEQYGLEKYNPHITISRAPIVLQQQYQGTLMPISEYYLLKKKEGKWQEIGKFSL